MKIIVQYKQFYNHKWGLQFMKNDGIIQTANSKQQTANSKQQTA